MKRSMVKCGPIAVVWFDAWKQKRGLAVEWCRGRGRSLVSFGFGKE